MDYKINDINECLRALEVPDDMEIEYLSYTEKVRYRICMNIEEKNTVIVDASLFDKETLKKIIKYLKERSANYMVINT
jgi:hypoxanthine-guanine phosphoribosyltransferase